MYGLRGKVGAMRSRERMVIAGSGTDGERWNQAGIPRRDREVAATQRFFRWEGMN